MSTSMIARTRSRSGALRTVVVPVACVLGIAVTVGACRPSDVLSVPPPSGVTPSTVYQNQAGAEGLLTHGQAQVFEGLAEGLGASSGVLAWSGLLGDEFTWAFFSYGASDANVDARTTTGRSGFQEGGDQAISLLLGGRLTLLSAIPVLRAYEPASGRPRVGEAFALMGYAEVLLAEDYCAGTPLDALGSPRGIVYGAPLTMDSLLGAAEADFDSAAAYAGADATIAPLAAVGLARARLDRGEFAAAAMAVSGVPTSFVYNTVLDPGGYSSGANYVFNLYDQQAAANGCGLVNVADRKGGNGLNYVSAQDPRLVLSTAVAETCDGAYIGSADSVWYYPVKFGNPSMNVPLATGVEARLIEAEAALKANDAATWATDLNALRAAAPETYLALSVPMNALPTDSATGASAAEQIDVMFRERAFWLYGTGTRLGDMRRLIRQYARDQSTVFPTGSYPKASDPHLPSPLSNYGTDVSLTLPTPGSGLTDPNPAYRGCITSTKVA